MATRRMEKAACALVGAGLAALVAMPVAAEGIAAPTAAAAPALATPQAAAGAAAQAALEGRLRQLKLPPLEGLTLDSDFSAFIAPGVPEDIQRLAWAREYELRRAASTASDLEAGDYTPF